jgi:hypothetical protein
LLKIGIGLILYNGKPTKLTEFIVFLESPDTFHERFATRGKASGDAAGTKAPPWRPFADPRHPTSWTK